MLQGELESEERDYFYYIFFLKVISMKAVSFFPHELSGQFHDGTVLSPCYFLRRQKLRSFLSALQAL